MTQGREAENFVGLCAALNCRNRLINFLQHIISCHRNHPFPLESPNGIGSWMVYQGCDRNYAEQICAEEKILMIKNGKETEEWQKKSAQ